MRTIHTLIERGPVVFSDADTGRVIVLERSRARLTSWLPCPTLGYVEEKGYGTLSFDLDAYDGEDTLVLIEQEAEDLHAALCEEDATQEAA